MFYAGHHLQSIKTGEEILRPVRRRIVFSLFCQFRPSGLGYIFKIIRTMPAAIATTIAFFQMVLFGKYNQPIFAPIIMQALSQIFHR